jgi:hypothetical protein
MLLSCNQLSVNAGIWEKDLPDGNESDETIAWAIASLLISTRAGNSVELGEGEPRDGIQFFDVLRQSLRVLIDGPGGER